METCQRLRAEARRVGRWNAARRQRYADRAAARSRAAGKKYDRTGREVCNFQRSHECIGKAIGDVAYLLSGPVTFEAGQLRPPGLIRRQRTVSPERCRFMLLCQRRHGLRCLPSSKEKMFESGRCEGGGCVEVVGRRNVERWEQLWRRQPYCGHCSPVGSLDPLTVGYCSLYGYLYGCLGSPFEPRNMQDWFQTRWRSTSPCGAFCLHPQCSNFVLLDEGRTGGSLKGCARVVGALSCGTRSRAASSQRIPLLARCWRGPGTSLRRSSPHPNAHKKPSKPRLDLRKQPSPRQSGTTATTRPHSKKGPEASKIATSKKSFLSCLISSHKRTSC